MQQLGTSAPAKQLSSLPAGSVAVLSFIDNEEDCHVLRLCELGLIPGVSVELLKTGANGSPFLLRFNETDLCVDADLVKNFWVESHLEEHP